MADQERLEKVIEGLNDLRSHFRAMAGISSSRQGRANHIESARTIDEAIELLKEQEPMTVNERRDLEILRRVKSGKILKHGCADYVIYNGEWYRKNPWNHPQEPVKPIVTDGTRYILCGNCKQPLCRTSDNYLPSYCEECGRPVKWE